MADTIDRQAADAARAGHTNHLDTLAARQQDKSAFWLLYEIHQALQRSYAEDQLPDAWRSWWDLIRFCLGHQSVALWLSQEREALQRIQALAALAGKDELADILSQALQGHAQPAAVVVFSQLGAQDLQYALGAPAQEHFQGQDWSGTDAAVQLHCDGFAHTIAELILGEREKLFLPTPDGTRAGLQSQTKTHTRTQTGTQKSASAATAENPAGEGAAPMPARFSPSPSLPPAQALQDIVRSAWLDVRPLADGGAQTLIAGQAGQTAQQTGRGRASGLAGLAGLAGAQRPAQRQRLPLPVQHHSLPPLEGDLHEFYRLLWGDALAPLLDALRVSNGAQLYCHGQSVGLRLHPVEDWSAMHERMLQWAHTHIWPDAPAAVPAWLHSAICFAQGGMDHEYWMFATEGPWQGHVLLSETDVLLGQPRFASLDAFFTALLQDPAQVLGASGNLRYMVEATVCEVAAKS